MAVPQTAYNTLMGMFRQQQAPAGASVMEQAQADARNQMLGRLGFGLLAAAIPQTAAQRTQALQQAFGGMGDMGTSVYNNAQVRLAQQKMEREQKAEEAQARLLQGLGQAPSIAAQFAPAGAPVREGGFASQVAPVQSMAPVAPAAQGDIFSTLTPAQISIVRGIQQTAGPSQAVAQAVEFATSNVTPKPDPLASLKARAQEAGIKPGTKEYQEFMARGGAVPSVTNVNIGDKGSEQFAKAFAEADAKTIGEVTNAGLTAGQNLARLQGLKTLLAKTPTGGAAALKQLAGRYGIATEGLSEIQAIQALVNQLVPGQRPAGSGPMSDRDVQLFKDSLVAIINQPGGNAIILDMLERINQYDLEGARIVSEMRAGRLGVDENANRVRAFELLQARENPLLNFEVPEGAQNQDSGFSLSPEGQSAFDKYK